MREDVTALIPARDEGPRVGEVVRGARAQVGRVLVVVNGCTDDTAARALEAGAELLEADPGYARALAAGYRALAGGGPVVQLDADGQHPPEAIPSLLAALEGADLVIGRRSMARPGYPMPALRRGAILTLAAWTRLLTGQKVTDVTSGFMALSPRAVALFAASFPEALADANVIVRALRAGLVVVEVPVTMRERAGGRSMHVGPKAALYALRVALAALLERVSPPDTSG